MVWLWFLNLSSVPGAEENFAAEAAAARGAGIPVALIDHDALAEPGGAQRGGLARRDDDRRPVRRRRTPWTRLGPANATKNHLGTLDLGVSLRNREEQKLRQEAQT